MPLEKLIKALADKKRRDIIIELKKGKITSGDLAIAVNISPQALSYHLVKLKSANIIYESKHKNFIYYELDLTVLDELILWFDQLKKED